MVKGNAVVSHLAPARIYGSIQEACTALTIKILGLFIATIVIVEGKHDFFRNCICDGVVDEMSPPFGSNQTVKTQPGQML